MLRLSVLITLTLLTGSTNVFAQQQDDVQKHPSSSTTSSLRLHRVTDYFQSEVDQRRIAGAVLAVSIDGKVDYIKAIGYRNLESDRPMHADTLFRIASMTKPITSAAMMALIDDGLVKLDDPVSRYLPGFVAPRVLMSIEGESVETVDAKREPTIRDLLTHQSGLTYGWFGPKKLDVIYRKHEIPDLFEPVDESMGDRVTRIQKVPLKFHPGTAWDYGVSTDVLGHLVEVVSGKSLAEFLEERFFRPLKMQDTFFHVPAKERDRLAGLFTINEQQQLKAVGDTPIQAGFLRFSANYCTEPGQFYSGGGGLVSSAPDYLRFLQMLLNRGELEGVRVLSSESVAAMTQNQIGDLTLPFKDHGDGFGFGFGVVTDRDDKEIEFSVGTYSWGGIFNTYFWVDPKEKLAAVMMTQLFPYEHLKMRREFRKLVYAAISSEEPVVNVSEDNQQIATRSFAQYALTNAGDPKAGRKLFNESKLQCLVCHRVDKYGGQVGPELTNVGGKYDRPHLVDALLHPSNQISYGYESTTISTKAGRIYSGIVKNRSEKNLTLFDAKNQRQVIAQSDIEEMNTSKVSVMPSGLHTLIDKEQFADLIAYLETLGQGKNNKGSGISGPINLPAGFELTTVATGLSGATALEVAPDGRVFVCEQSGKLRIVVDDHLLEKPFAEVPVDMDWERGLIGVTTAPDFPRTPHVYAVYVAKAPYSHHRVSRFIALGNIAAQDGETILFRGDDQSQFGGNKPAGHQGGAIHFGPDGKLFVAIGDQTAGTPAQRMDALQGKILRLNQDGSVPKDNPFVNSTTGKYQAIWAMGCRNPFTFAFSETGKMFINDVGGRVEEINPGIAGANYGWPTVDHGPTNRPDMTGPIHTYPQSSLNGGDFCSSKSGWPMQFHEKYFFADFVQGWIKFIDPTHPKKSTEFITGIRRPVDMRFAPNGGLYVLLRNAWVVDNKFAPETGSLIRIDYIGNQK